jgi:DMSO reductase family type II enzyme heme b subunit
MIRPRRVPLFWSVALALVAVWLLLELALPWIGMWVTGYPRPLPVPGVVRLIYLALALVGAAVYVTISDESIAEFLRPLIAGLRGPDPASPRARGLRGARLAVLVLVPLAAGGFVYARTAPRIQSPTVLRIQHPTLPGAYERMRNPFRERLDERTLAEGYQIFQINCRPCHGDAADGAGPMAWGFRLKPANFTDPGTIATVVEAYAFWRVTEGGPGLPPEGTPWDSAMPAWRQDLTDEQKWKAVMAAYDLAGVEPRKPEKLESVLVGAAWAQAKPAETPESLERGKKIYAKRCLACHGDKGDGQGPVAPYLNPRPRDFTLGAYKFRTTGSGEPPTDEDLFRVITRGVPGTAMSGWTTLSAEERWLVVGYVKKFSDAFKEKGTVVTPAKEPSASPELLARGKDVYKRAKCWECHGESGRGDGPSAPTLKDDAKDAIRAANLRKGWLIKGGREPRDIFMRFSTGVDGTPMPSYADSLAEDDRWALAHYVASLQTKEEPSAAVVLRAARVAGELPADPGDPRWQAAPRLVMPLAGQVIAKPRWQNHAVDAVTVRALYTDRAMAFLLEWDDWFKNVEHRPGPEPELRPWTYPKIDLNPERTHTLRDAVRLQFPVTVPAGPERPHFLLGSPGQPVALWHWRADLNERGGNAVVKERAEGFPKPIADLPAEAQDVSGRGAWAEGRWRVVMTRPLVPKDPTKDVTFEPGRLIPFAVQAWDGANGETGLLMALSSWHFLVLETPTPVSAYLFPLLGIGVVGLAEWWLVRRVRQTA